MKAEHRHDLKTNELAQWINALPESIGKNLKTIIIVILVVVAVVAYFFYYRYQTTIVTKRDQIAVTGLLSQMSVLTPRIAREQARGNDTSDILLQMEQGLQNISAGAKQDSLRALALIKEAQLIRAELNLRFGAIGPQDLDAAITRAKDDYTKALDIYLKRSPNPSLEAMAKMGLGLCEEDLGNIEQAKKIYNEVADAPEYEGTTSAQAAKNRLAVMDYFNSQKITLKSEPVPAAVEIAEPNELAAPEFLFSQTAPEANVQGVNSLP
jgi:tetratricopeptide (TPR) repeat protein